MTESDQQLQTTAEAMIAAAAAGESATEVLARCCPDVWRQIDLVKRCPALLPLWGRSINFDENVQQEIVHPAILHAISKVAGVRLGKRIVHAGLQHTYGYLFSLIDTPYGFKRTRWTSPDLDAALGFGRPTLRAHPAEGSLLSNLTYFLGRFVAPAWPRATLEVAPELLTYSYASLRRRRIVEEVARSPRPLVIHTDLVELPLPQGDLQSLLIYSLLTGSGEVKLFTTFPVSAAMENALLASAGRDVSIRLRYNAHVPGLQGKVLVGTRTVKTES